MNIWEEMLNCSKDFVYFSNEYLNIIHPKKGMMPLDLYGYHERLVEAWGQHRFLAVKKFRQGGFLTVTALHGLWECLFHQEKRVFCLSPSYKEAEEVAELISVSINALPDWMKCIVQGNTKHRKTFATGSMMEFYTWEACRSRKITHLIIDEAAFIKELDRKWKYIYPCLGTDGRCTVLSTTNGVGNWFYDIWDSATKGESNFHAFEASYKDHPDYQDEKHCEVMRKALGEKGWHQEVLADFVV